MNGNYEWQRYQVNERIQARLRDGEAHRQAKQARGRPRTALAVDTMAMAIVAVVIVALWFLTGCTPGSKVAAVEQAGRAQVVDARVARSGWTMAERIQFQDRRDQALARAALPGWTMAERIRFQDRRDQVLVTEGALATHNGDPSGR